MSAEEHPVPAPRPAGRAGRCLRLEPSDLRGLADRRPPWGQSRNSVFSRQFLGPLTAQEQEEGDQADTFLPVLNCGVQLCLPWVKQRRRESGRANNQILIMVSLQSLGGALARWLDFASALGAGGQEKVVFVLSD